MSRSIRLACGVVALAVTLSTRGSALSGTTQQFGASPASGATIAGRLVNRLGQPMSNVQVELLTKDIPSGMLGRTGHQTLTDNSGGFRLGALDAGHYFLCSTVLSRELNTQAYAPTCYPGTSTVANARVIALRVGENRDGSFAMQTIPRLATVSGTANDVNGQSLQDGSAVLTARAGFPGPYTGPIQGNGSFGIVGVPPGEYVAATRSLATPTPAQRYRPDRSIALVNVKTDDVSGVVLAPIKAVTISGRLIVPVNATASMQTRFIRIGTVEASLQPFVRPPPPAPVVNPDLTFEFTAPALPVVIHVLGAGSLLQKSVRIGSRNFVDAPIDLRSGLDVNGVEIELTESPSLNATAITADGQAARDWCFLVFPQDRSRWTSPDPLGNSFAVLWHIDARPFAIRTLAPGRYYAVALSRYDNGWRDPDFLDTLRPRALGFELGEAERKTLNLRLVLLP